MVPTASHLKGQAAFYSSILMLPVHVNFTSSTYYTVLRKNTHF